jgi:predicted AlkP superfamily phosphohydrolase/phosphomutase
MNKSLRLFILGIDGMDPDIFSYLKKRGKMPNLGNIADKEYFRYFKTANPPQSPVSWTNIATGTDAGTHGICDFLHRDPKTYTPELSLFGIEPYKGGVKYTSRVRVPSVFKNAMDKGIRTTLIRWPLTFPAPESLPANSRMLCGMGVPDLLGTLGRYSFYTTDEALTKKDIHGRIVLIRASGNKVKTQLYGPRYRGFTGMKESVVEMILERTDEGLKVELPDKTINLKTGQWSSHLIVRFSMGMMGKVTAITRMLCIDSTNFPSLFVLPLQIYPKETNLPLSSPKSFSAELWDMTGPYLTLGMPEDTNGLKDGLIPEGAFLSLCDDIFSERKRMLEMLLKDFNSGIMACVFDTLDRIQHMFWRQDVRVFEKGKEADGVIAEWYMKMDELIGWVMNNLGGDVPLFIISDHGFAPLNRYVHLNAWLTKNGYMSFKDTTKSSGPLFENVDWSRTTAYALGFNSIYINLKGREGKGIVEPEKMDLLCNEIIDKLSKWKDGEAEVIKGIYKSKEAYNMKHDNAPDLIVGYNRGYRASKQTVLGAAPGGVLLEDNHESWSGDHCCDSELVPGVLFGTNLDNSGMNLPDKVCVNDVAALIGKWLSVNFGN